MKTLTKIIIIFWLLNMLSCDVTETNDNSLIINIPSGNESAVPDSIKNIFRIDAAKLAWELMSKDSSALQTQVEISQSALNSFYNSLIHIYNFNHPARDTVINSYKIHAFSYIDLKIMFVRVDTAAEWTKAWQNGNTLTGNDEVDDLIKKYKLFLVEYPASIFHPVARLDAEQPVNTVALSNKFDTINGVVYADPNGWVGDGNDVRLEEISVSYLKISFSAGWGDCPAGCINRHFWNFLVYSDGGVEFGGESGAPLP